MDSECFTRGVADIVTREGLTTLLGLKKQLRVKHGIDATSPDLHLGHAANLWKLRALQEAGHKAVILLGDVTTRIGDPTGKSKTRPQLSKKDIEKNIRAIEKQIRAILLTSPKVFELRKSSEWYGKMRMAEFLHLLSQVTHARLIERDMFRERIKKGSEIFMHELVYPILQGYDSVELRSDMTVIGSDQLFNEHMGRFFQERFGQNPQVIVALSLLPGLGGGEKMSKSLGNHIALSDSPRDKFGKAMRVADELIVSYLEAYTDVPTGEVREIQKKLAGGMNPVRSQTTLLSADSHADRTSNGMNPRDAKLVLAQALVRRYHGEAAAGKEREYFLQVFSKKEIPRNIETLFVNTKKPSDLLDLVCAADTGVSKAQALRLILQGAVTIDGVRKTDRKEMVALREGSILRIGPKKLFKIKNPPR